MKMMTKAIESKLPALYTTDGKPYDQRKVWVKFFAPWSNWTWYVLEGTKQDDGDWMFYGLVEGFERERGYFSLNELMSVRGPMGLRIERDLHFTPVTLDELNYRLSRFAEAT